MKKTTTKVLAIFLALSMMFTMALSASAAEATKIEPNIIYCMASPDGTYGIDLDSNFVDFANPDSSETPIQIYIYNTETDGYDLLQNVSASVVFQSYSSEGYTDEGYTNEDASSFDVTEIYANFYELEAGIDYDAEYLIVIPEGTFVTEDGSVNAEVSQSVLGSEFEEYQMTPIDLIMMWLSDYASFLTSPISFLAETIMVVQALITGNMDAFSGFYVG